MQKDFKGWKCDSITSGLTELLITISIGPRIISLTHNNSENLFHVIEADTLETDSTKYKHYGGHRLWTTPEDIAHTYHIENSQVSKDEENWYSSSPDPRGLLKSFQVQPVEHGFKVTHRLLNVGHAEVESSPWGITMLKPGGFGFFPDEPAQSHGSNSFLPVRSLSLWSYTRMNDPRIKFGNGLTQVFQQREHGPFKIGAYVSLGWGGYYVDGLVFLKTFGGEADHYPDRGANFEIFTNENLLETETTGTVRNLKPGESVTCSEIWQVFECDLENLQSACEERSNLVRGLL